jgi:hypothetical protein
MSDTLLILVAISIIVIGALLLAGLAIWLAIDRNRQVSAGRGQTSQPSGNAPARAAEPSRPAASSAPKGPKAPAQQKDVAGPAEIKPTKDAASSGEYPAASQYDQTLLPPPKRRTRSQ